MAADLASYNILLKSCCLAARVDLAKDIYKEVRKFELTGILKLDVFTYSTMIKVKHCVGCCSSLGFYVLVNEFLGKEWSEIVVVIQPLSCFKCSSFIHGKECRVYDVFLA